MSEKEKYSVAGIVGHDDWSSLLATEPVAVAFSLKSGCQDPVVPQSSHFASNEFSSHV